MSNAQPTEAPSQALALRLEDQLATMDWSGMEDSAPRIAPFGQFSWYHGAKQARTPGVFYGKEMEFAEMPGNPWTPDDRFNQGANPELGFSAAMLRLAFIGVRSQWFTPKDDETNTPFAWLTEYKQGARKSVEYLVFVEGVDTPMILSGSKPSKTVPFAKILGQYRRGLLKQAGLRMRRPLPLWFFWLPIAGEKGPDGKPVFTEAKDANGKSYGSYITEPKLYLPANAADTLFVGPDLLRYGNELRREYAWWFEEVRLPDNTVEAEYEVEEAPVRRNVPQPIESDESLPF